jgi:hypothetical protein
LLGPVGGVEPDRALVELSAELGEAVLGEVIGGELEGRGVTTLTSGYAVG